MPTYVYECSSCNTQFEVMQRITEAPLDTCECGSTGTVKRVIQPVGIAFKGSGFHINDYASSSAPAPASTSTPAADPAPAAPATPTPAPAPSGE